MPRPWYVIEGPGDGRAGPRHCFTVVNAPPQPRRRRKDAGDVRLSLVLKGGK